MARIAALSGAGSFSQTVTIRVRSEQVETLACVPSCVPASQTPCKKWRREGDSNPRYGFWPYTGLANQRLQPLGHLSKPLILLIKCAIAETTHFAIAYRRCIP